MKTILDFKEKEFMSDVKKLNYQYSTMRCILSSMFNIQVDNSKANSHNTNIDCPTYFCFAINQAEAVGQMILSDWPYKNLPITKITVE